VMVFARGAAGSDPTYGHVAVVERVNSDGSVLISEGGVGFATFPSYRTIRNAGNYEYVHY
ncbi:CHAP domain-containing protein, partial [Gardnerella vaginalis]